MFAGPVLFWVVLAPHSVMPGLVPGIHALLRTPSDSGL